MYTPYTYYIEHIPTGKKYYGARWATGCNPKDFWVTYFTSSKKVKQLINEYGADSFKTEVRKTFTSVNQCKMWERKVLKRLNVIIKEEWLNQNFGTPPSLKGIKWSSDRKEKAKGKKLSEEHKKNISIANKGKHRPQTAEHKLKGAISRTGLKRTGESKEKISDAHLLRLPIINFLNILSNEVYKGTAKQLADRYNLNYNSLKTGMSKNNYHRGWIKS